MLKNTMLKKTTRHFWPLLLLVLSFALTACPSASGPAGAPQIVSFTANPTSIPAAGQKVTLSWEIVGGVTGLEIDGGIGPVSGTSKVVYPTAATTYTLTATNSAGNATETVEVGLGAAPGGPLVEDGLSPKGTFGVGLAQSGPFQSDGTGDIESPADERVVRVEAGGSFYALVSYRDPGGIAGVDIYIANSSPPGLKADLVQGQSVGGFTLVGEVGGGGCVLDGTQTTVNCIYEIAVGDIPNIDQLEGAGSEFAYVFRTNVTDAAGNESDAPPRGYVIVGDSGGGGGTANRDPVAAFTNTQTASDSRGVSIKFSALNSADPDGDPLGYTWDFGDGSGANSRDYTKTYTADGSYLVKLTVSDGRGGTDSETKTLTIDVPGGGTPPPPPPTPTPPPPPPPPPAPEKEDPVARFDYSPAKVSAGDSVTLDGRASSDPDGGGIETYAWEVTGPLGVTTDFSGPTPSFTAVNPGNYQVSLVVTDDEGAASEAAGETISVAATGGGGGNRPPTVSIKGDDEREAVEGRPVRLEAVGRDSDKDRLSYLWTASPASGAVFSTPTLPNTFVTFSDHDDDDYTITVTVDDGRRGRASDSVAFEVDEADDDGDEGESDLRADFEYAASGTTVQFTSSIEGASGNVGSHSWFFGDDAIGGGSSAEHTYAEQGKYRVTLVVRDDTGRSAVVAKDVIVSR